MDFWTRIKTEPAVLTQAVQALLGLMVAFNVINLTSDQTGAILAFIAAGLGLVLALDVRPFKWSFVTGLVQAAIALLAEFGFDFSSEQVASIYTATAVLGAILVRQVSTPETKLPAIAPMPGPGASGPRV